MKYNPEIHHRKSIRLHGYDYSQAGLYFITICCQNRECLFGDIVNEKMALNNAGEMVEQIWNEILDDFQNIKLHEMIIMPNHIHVIIEIIKPVTVGADSISAQPNEPSISMVVQSFKRHSTIQYIKMVKNGILPRFDNRIWQRNYWEHIIRDENEYQGAVEYIINNPMKWDMDKLNGGDGNKIMERQSKYNSEIWMV